jgi:outer membrane protein assembly factor BamB
MKATAPTPMTAPVLTVSLLALLVAAACGGAEWPRFRGPDGAGIAAADATPATTWSETSHLQWKAALPGAGSSSPIVAGGRIFVSCYSGYGVDGGEGGQDQLVRHLVCLARDSGKILWDSAVPAELPEDPYAGFLREHGYASSTPVTDGEHVFVFFGKSGVLAFDFDGHQLWKVNLGKRSSPRRWGSGASPLLYENLVIVNAADESRTLFALDKRSGKEVWKTEVAALDLSFVTPILVAGEGGRSDLVLAVPGELWGLNPETGKLRWFAQTQITGNVSPSVVAADGVIYATGGYPAQGTIAVRAGGKGDVTQSHVLWSSETASYVPSPVVCHGHLFFVSDQGFATCMEAKTGKVVYKERLPGLRGSKPFYASVVLANDRLYAASRRAGTYVLATTPKFALLAHNTLAGDDSDFNGTPAVVGRQLFLRSNRFLYCIDAGAGGRSE